MNQSLSIDDRLSSIRSNIKDGVKLIAVSKFHGVEKIRNAYDAGQRLFGESRVQELTQKYELLKDLSDIEWHFIGKLQRNKVKYIVPFISLIHSVDSISLLDEIQKQAKKINRIVPVLLEFKIAQEDTKSGLSEKELFDIVDKIYKNPNLYSNIELRGIMAMSTNTEDDNLIEKEFSITKSLFDNIKQNNIAKDSFVELSMGMSGDYILAMKYGATLVRIGTSIFGDREY